MSYDFDTLGIACDHYLVRERLFVHAQDGRTLHSVADPSMRLRGPINAKSLTRLRVNGILVAKDHPVYGWDLYDDELSVPPEKKMKVVFTRPVRYQSLLIEVEYQSSAPYCLKCGGKGVLNDIQVTSMNSLRRVIMRRKLAQRGLKFLLTSQCNFYPNLTCRLRDFVGAKFGISLTEEDISMEAGSALDRLRSVQGYQAQVQKLSPEETLRSIDGVEVNRDPDDPTMVYVALNVSGYKGTSTELAFGMRIRT
jgi:hypothetical protein